MNVRRLMHRKRSSALSEFWDVRWVCGVSKVEVL